MPSQSLSDLGRYRSLPRDPHRPPLTGTWFDRRQGVRRPSPSRRDPNSLHSYPRPGSHKPPQTAEEIAGPALSRGELRLVCGDLPHGRGETPKRRSCPAFPQRELPASVAVHQQVKRGGSFRGLDYGCKGKGVSWRLIGIDLMN